MNLNRGKRQINKDRIQETYNVRQEGDLLTFLMEISGRSRSATKKLLTSAKVLVNNQYQTHHAFNLKPGDVVQVSRIAQPKEFNHPKIKILWEDEYYVVFEKLHGIYTVDTTRKHHDKTAMWALSRHYKQTDEGSRLFMINRLDRETSGIIVFAKSIEAKENLIDNWSRLVQQQRFVAAVDGVPANKTMTFKTVSRKYGSYSQKGDERGTPVASEVDIKLLRTDSEKSVIQLDVQKGRIYSLRKVLSDRELTILGDQRHGSEYELRGKIALEQIGFAFRHPFTGEVHRFSRKFPTHLFGFLGQDQVDNN